MDWQQMREHCQGNRFSQNSQAWNFRWQDHAESAAEVEAGWGGGAVRKSSDSR